VFFQKNLTLISLAILTALAGGIPLPAQTVYQLEKLGIDEGLSQGYVGCLWQDSEGFIWIGTKNGLNRYDGYGFKVFTHNPFDPGSISTDWVHSIQEYGDFLVMGLARSGIDIFNKRTFRSFSLRLKGNKPVRLEESSVHQCFVDKRGDIYARVTTPEQTAWFLKISFPGGWPRSFEPSGKEASGQVLSSTRHREKFFFEGDLKGDKIWYCIENILTGIDLETGERKNIEIPGPLPDNGINDLKVASDGMLWISSEKAVGRFDGSGWETIYTPFPVTAIFTAPDYKGGVFLKSGPKLFTFDKSGFEALSWRVSGAGAAIERHVLDLIQDRSGVIWMGTGGFGVLKFNPRLQRFRREISGVSVNSPIMLDAAGATAFKTVNRIIAAHPLHPALDFSGHPDAIDFMSSDAQGLFWAMLRKENGKAALLRQGSGRRWETITAFQPEVNELPIFKFDEQGSLWMANAGKLHRFDPATMGQTVYDYGKSIDHRVFDLTKTPDGHWWIGTDKGLVQAVPEGKGFQFRWHAVQPGDKNSVSNNNISCLLPDPSDSDRLWIGTRGGGVNRLALASLNFSHLTTANGLPNDVIYGILADATGVLWMSSNKGIIRYDPSSGAIRNYTAADGLPANEFNTWAYAKASDGTMYFGCVEGLVAFHSDEFTENPAAPEVRITTLEVNNAIVTHSDDSGILAEAIEFTSHITLPYSQNNIGLELAALEFSVPAQNRFRYYLGGAEPEWTHETAERHVRYLNLPPGRYTFYAKACNNDGVWHETPTTLHITILPPWYRTNLAYFLYGLSFLAALYGVFQFFLYRQRLQHELALEQKEAERLKELDDFKSRLYTDITHEFRTPLTVIQGMADEIAGASEATPVEKLKRAGKMIKRNGAGLLQLINHILDLAKLEAKSLKLRRAPGDLAGFAKYLTRSFESLAATQGIALRFNSEPGEILMQMDKERFKTILSNLLSNALKFTPGEGEIGVSIRRADDWEKLLGDGFFRALTPAGGHSGDWVSIVVSNTGPGIRAELLPRVFERFYQTDLRESRSSQGTGIGLALVRELVHLMRGALAVRSDEGRGAEFVVILPVVHVSHETEATEKFSEDMPPVAEESGELSVTTGHAPAGTSNPGLPAALIVEDNADVLHYIVACVGDSYRVTTAKNGQEGMEKAFDSPPDLVITDVMMPVKDGFELADTLKNDERTSHIPIIILTALATEADKLRALRMGVDDYLAKPFSPDELRARAANLVRNYRRRQTFRAQGVHIEFESTPSADQVWLKEIEEHCLAAIDKRLDLGAGYLADQMALSERQLLRRLNVLTGLSTQQYIQEVKLQKARHQLEHKTFNTVSEIAYACGFNTPNYFAKVFRQRFGKLPSDYLESAE
jgi:signal transduction histidine kinase/DNA-binding response OmpR family regulator/streptogramin lyase